jgi:uncharacterized membrane protein YeiB
MRAAEEATVAARSTRSAAIDAARGLAVLGMVLAHVVPTRFPPTQGPRWSVLPAALVHGRAATLFVVLAGFSLAWSAGERPGPAVPAGTAPASPRWAEVRMAALARVPLLWLAGWLLLLDDPSPVYVIVHVYALYTLVGVLALRWNVVTRLVVGTGLLAGWPVLLLLVPSLAEAVAGADAGLPDTVPHLSTALVTGAYPVLPWAGFLLVGMALAALPWLCRPWRLVAAGWGAAMVTHLVGLISGVLAGRPAIASLGVGSTPAATAVELSRYDSQARLLAVPPTWLGQLSAEGHRASVVGLFSCLAFAVIVLALCTAIAASGRAGRWARVASPLLALGRCALSAYVLHVLFLGRRWLPSDPPAALFAALALAAALAVLGQLWLRAFRRGPLELAVRVVTGWAARQTSHRPRPSKQSI